MSNRIAPRIDHSIKEITNRTNKSNRTTTKGKRKSLKSNKLTKAQKISHETKKPITEVKSSLREECLRLASFLRQETHRPGYVR